MSLYEINGERITQVETTTFLRESLRERDDLQRLLRDNIEIVATDAMVLAEEFGDWDDSHRRIDLLCLDRGANLVVCELKRSEAGGHMELQAIRYAAMVSTMTFEQAVRAHAAYLKARGWEKDAESEILKFLEWGAPDEAEFAPDVRIVLVSAEFSRELTTSVLWLLERDLDVRCVRLRPHTLHGNVVLDVQQVLPLPEAEDYQVRVREKERSERSVRKSTLDFTRFDLSVGGRQHLRQWKRNAIYLVVKYLVESGEAPDAIAKVIDRASFPWISVDGLLDGQVLRDSIAASRLGKGRVFDQRRWFCGDGEVIHHGAKSYVFTNQWGKSAVDAIGRLAAAYPHAGIRLEKSSMTEAGD